MGKEIEYTENIMPIMTGNETDGVKVSGNYSNTYYPYLAFDRKNNTRWVVWNFKSAWLKAEFPNNKNISKYEIFGVRKQTFPKNWTFEGSNNDIDWITLDTQTNRNNTQNVYFIDNKDTYKFYRLNITAIDGSSGYTDLEIIEVNYYARIPEVYCLVKQEANYILINNNYYNLGRPRNDEQLIEWYKKYGYENPDIISDKLNIKDFPLITPESSTSYKTMFELDANEIINSIEFIEDETGEKSDIIRHGTKEYRIYDKLADRFDKFEITMIE